jgi:hypothetical protein
MSEGDLCALQVSLHARSPSLAVAPRGGFCRRGLMRGRPGRGPQARVRGLLVRRAVSHARAEFAQLCRLLDPPPEEASEPRVPVLPPEEPPLSEPQVLPSAVASAAAAPAIAPAPEPRHLEAPATTTTIQIPVSAAARDMRRSLLQQRQVLAMELLWTRQCIHSREHVRMRPAAMVRCYQLANGIIRQYLRVQRALLENSEATDGLLL